MNEIELYTKNQIVDMYANDQLELDEHLDYQAEQMGITTKALAKNIAETEFDIAISEGTIVKVGRKYRIL